MDALGLSGHRARQEATAREASRLSKMVSANAMTSMEGYAGRLDRINAAREECDGQTCMVDVALQERMLAAEVEAQRLMVTAADVRAREAQQDYDRAARERAVQNRRINRAGLTEYGG